MSVRPIPQSVLDLADEMDTGPRPPDWAVFTVAAWPLMYAAALRHAADEIVAHGEAHGHIGDNGHLYANHLRRLADEATA